MAAWLPAETPDKGVTGNRTHTGGAHMIDKIIDWLIKVGICVEITDTQEV